MNNKVLVVDDDRDVSDFLKKAILKYNRQCIVKTTHSVPDAIRELVKAPYDILITDINMPEVSGFYLVEYVKKHFPDCKIVIMSGEPSLLKDAAKFNINGCLLKPFSVSELIEKLKFGSEKKLQYLQKE